MESDDRPTGRVVSVFGGSRATEADPEYRDAYELGRLLADRHRQLAGDLPALAIVGGCCGTDARHVDALWSEGLP